MGMKIVLLVEDHEENRDVYSTILRVSGYEVLEAVNGQEGIRIAREQRPDLILMDITIPLVDGWTATRTLKSDPVTGTIPIIALTGLDGDREREVAREAGCDAFLAKPVEPRRIVEEVERILRQGRGE